MSEEVSNIIISPLFKVVNGKAFKLTCKLVLNEAFVIADLNTFLETLEANGYMPVEPGLEPGEESETMHYILRVDVVDGEGSTPRIFFYPEKYKRTSKYLNNADDIAEFEASTGLQLSKIPVFPGGGALVRGENAAADKQYIVPLPHPIQVIWKLNPKYQGEGDKKNEKHKFVRYVGVHAPLGHAPKTDKKPSNSNAAPEPAQSSTTPPDTGGNAVLGKIFSVKVHPADPGKKNPYLMAMVEVNGQQTNIKIGGRDLLRAAFKGHALATDIEAMQVGDDLAFVPPLACHVEKAANGGWMITNIIPVPPEQAIDIPF